jgi:hypothetical protein
VEEGEQCRVFVRVSGCVAFEDEGAGVRGEVLAGETVDFLESGVTFLVVDPYDLEWAVALEGAGGVVVDGFAGSGEEAWGGVVIVHDEEGIGFIALEGDADDHLTEGGSCEGVGAAEGLGSEDDVDSEGAALADEAIEEEGGVLGDAVVFSEELLELVDEEEGAGQGFGVGCAEVSGEVLDTELAEEIAAVAEFVVDTLQHAKAELPIAFDGDDAGMGELVSGVAFELDALFEVDEVELDLGGVGPEGEVGDEHVEEGRLAGAGFAGDEDVLAGAFSEGEVLEFIGAGEADGDAEFGGGIEGPAGVDGGHDFGEGHFDAIRVDARLADLLEEPGGEGGVGRGFQHEGGTVSGVVGQGGGCAGDFDAGAGVAEIIGDELGGDGLALVPMDEGEDAAPGAAGGEAEESAQGGIGEMGGEIGDDEEVPGFGDTAGLGVVIGEGAEFVAEVELGDFFDVITEVGEALFDLVGLGPDAAVDEAVFVIGEVHEAGEALAEADWIEEGEQGAAGGAAGEQAEHEAIEGVQGGVASGVGGFDQERALVGEGQEEWEVELGGAGQCECGVSGQATRECVEVYFETGERCRGDETIRRRPLAPGGGVPVREEARRGLACVLEDGEGGLGGASPVLLEGGPG